MKKNLARFALFGGSLVLSSCTFNGTNLGQNNSPGKTESDSGLVETSGDHINDFVKSFSSYVSSGISIHFDDLRVEIGEKHNNVITLNENYDAYGSLYVHGLSIHDLCFDVSLPLSYNGLIRGVKASLVDEILYISLFNLEDTDSRTYDVRYKTSTAPYDAIDSETGESIDPATGGTYRYEYGDLDWIIEDTIEHITGEKTNVDEGNKDSVTIDVKAIIDSLNELEEYEDNGLPYFVWNLPIGEKIYSLGLKADASYQWSGVDFPSKTINDLYWASSDFGFSFKASIETDPNCNITHPKDANAYVNVIDSMSIFHKIIDYANAEAFSVRTRDGGLSLSHHEEASGGGTLFESPEIDETAKIDLSADFEFENTKIKDIYTHLKYQYEGGFTHNIKVRIDGDGEGAFDQIYLSMNDLDKAKTNKGVFDAVLGSLDKVLGKTDDGKDKGEKVNALKLSNSISKAVRAIKESGAVSNLKDGTYEELLKGVTTFLGRENNIIVTFDLSVFGMEGSIELNLIGEENNASVGYIKFIDAKIDPFWINGQIDIIPYEGTHMSEEEEAEYKELRHLQSLGDQFETITDKEQVQFGINGYLLKEETTSVVTNNYQCGNKTLDQRQGYVFTGSMGLKTGENNYMAGSLTLYNRAESFVGETHVKFDMTGSEPTNEDGEYYQKDEEVYTSSNPSDGWVLFELDSAPTSKPSGENRTDPSLSPLKGRVAMHSLRGIMDVLRDLFNSNDPRLERIIKFITDVFIDSLLGKIIKGNYLEVLGSDLIKRISLNSRSDEFVISEELLGGRSPLKITVNYSEDKTITDSETEEESLIGGDIESIELELSFGGEAKTPSEIYLKIDVLGYEAQELNFANPNMSDFENYSSLKSLVEYAEGMFMSGENIDGVIRSAYHITGKATLNLNIIGLTLSQIDLTFNVFVRVEGADIRILAMIDIPIKTGLTAKSGYIYGGTRHTSLYFHTAGRDDDSYFLIDRYDDNYSLTNRSDGSKNTTEKYHYQTKLTPEEFKRDVVGYIMGDMLGMNDTIMGSLTSGSISSTSQPLHIEDLIKGYSFNNDLNNPAWDLILGISALTHSSLIGDLSITMGGGINESGDHVLTSAATKSDLEILGGVIKVSFNLQIDNLMPRYRYCWNDTIDNVAYKVNVTEEKPIAVTHTYYQVLYGSYTCDYLFSNNFIQVNDDGSYSLAPSYDALPFATGSSNKY